MNKLLLSVWLCLGLTACTTPGEQGTTTEQPPTSSGSGNEAVSADKMNPDKTASGTAELDTKKSDSKKPDSQKPDSQKQMASKPKPTKPKSQPVKTSDGKLILGREEWVYVPDMKQSFKAKVDAGATISSAAAVEIIPFERDGDRWVKFKIKHNGTVSRQMSSPVVRWIKTRQEGSDKSQKRPVVTAWIEVGTVKQKADFILTDGLEGDYAIILGQSFFRDIAIIDMNRKRVQPQKR